MYQNRRSRRYSACPIRLTDVQPSPIRSCGWELLSRGIASPPPRSRLAERAVKPKLDITSRREAFRSFRLAILDMAQACLAGLWLYHDFLDESHSISQEIATSTGSFWHGIMHRREPDPSNAKYWFRTRRPSSRVRGTGGRGGGVGLSRDGQPGIPSPSWIPVRNTGVREVRRNGLLSGCNSASGSLLLTGVINGRSGSHRGRMGKRQAARGSPPN